MTLNPLDSVGNLVDKVGGNIDKNFESGEERQQQLSDRHRVDMSSDNKLSKMIRPMTLIFLGLMEAVIVVAAVMGVSIDIAITSQVGLLLGSAVGFYFDSKKKERIAEKNAAANMEIKKMEMKETKRENRRDARAERKAARKDESI